MVKSDFSTAKVKFGIIIISIIVFWKFIFIPLDTWHNDNIDQIFILKKNIHSKETLLKQKESIDRDLQKVSGSLAHASAFFKHDFKDSGKLFLSLQKELEKTAKDKNVKIRSANWGQATGNTFIKAPVDLKVNALPKDLLNFMAEIESTEKFYTIDSVRFICQNRLTEIQADLVISLYGIK